MKIELELTKDEFYILYDLLNEKINTLINNGNTNWTNYDSILYKLVDSMPIE